MKSSISGVCCRSRFTLTVLAATFNSNLHIVNSSRLIVQHYEYLHGHLVTKLIRVKYFQKMKEKTWCGKMKLMPACFTVMLTLEYKVTVGFNREI